MTMFEVTIRSLDNEITRSPVREFVCLRVWELMIAKMLKPARLGRGKKIVDLSPRPPREYARKG
ncbi:hypothetical protein PanWU01x14_033220 [Parasponia andersonii]|uniref:Uncharacterized protein n=1 Tax=Parasponia andersonii TaxID=3476 RepID=A0A2P5DTL6_PARAD|nr:hypothetical protein PanWU01x14_033220 [Parasponia andersonii]